MKRLSVFFLIVVLGILFVACAQPTPQVIEKQVVQTVVNPVPQTVIVEKQVPVTPTSPPPTALPVVKEGGTLSLLIESAPPALYPPADEDRLSVMVYDLVYDPLFFYNDKMEAVPELADKYDISADGLTYTVTLKKDVKWHDGQPFTAKDVKFTFEQNCTKFAGFYANYKSISGCQDYHDGKATEVKGIQIVDDYTVKFVLSEPNAAFPTALIYYVIPEHIFKGMDIDTARRTAWKPIGTGPFKFVQYKEDQYVEFDVNPSYFKGKPHIDKIFMKVATVDNGIAMLEKGDIDFIPDLPASEVQRLSTNPSVKILETANKNWPWEMAINEKHFKFADKRVRQALMYAVNRQGYIDSVLGGHGTLAYLQWQEPGWALPPQGTLNDYAYNPDKAKQLLKDAGWNPDWNVEMLAYPGNKQRYDFAVIAQQDLAAVGIKVTIETMDVARAVDRVTAGTFDFLLTGGGAQADPSTQAMYFLCDSTMPNGGYNDGYYCNPKVDELFKNGLTLFTVQERAGLYRTGQDHK